MQVFKNGFHLFGIIEAIVNKKFEFGDDSGLLSDTATEFQADLRLIFFRLLRISRGLGALKTLRMNAGQSQIWSDFNPCHCLK